LISRTRRPAHPLSERNSDAHPDPEIILDGTAGQNQPYFDFVNRRLIEAGGTLGGRAFIDNLVAAGYPKAEMELTLIARRTAGRPATSSLWCDSTAPV
jgi:hypothetical protein